jgi:hypothetical protein
MFVGSFFNLFGHHVISHFGMPKSMPAQSQNLSSLVIWICIDNKLLVNASKSSTLIIELVFKFGVLKDGTCSLGCNQLSNQLSNGSLKIRHGHSMSLCIVFLCIWTNCGCLKYSPMNFVVEYE